MPKHKNGRGNITETDKWHWKSGAAKHTNGKNINNNEYIQTSQNQEQEELNIIVQRQDSIW